MRWLLDEMLPRAAVDALNERGHDAVSVVDIARPHAQSMLDDAEDELAKRGRMRVQRADQRS